MDTNEDWLKKLWFNPLVRRIRTNSWVLSVCFLATLYGFTVLVLKPIVPFLTLIFMKVPLVAFPILLLIGVRYTLFKKK